MFGTVKIARQLNLIRPRGFTLTELLVVIAIIAVLAGISIPAVMMAFNRGFEFKISTRVNQLEVAVETFRNEIGLYPPDNYFDRDGSVVQWIDPSLNDTDLFIRLRGRYGPLLQKMSPNHREFQPSSDFSESVYPIVAWYKQRGQYLNPSNALTFYLGGGLTQSSTNPLSETCVRQGENATDYQTRMANLGRRVFFQFSEYSIDPLDFWGPNDFDPFLGNPYYPDGCPAILRSPVQNSTELPLIYFVDSKWPTAPAALPQSDAFSLYTPYLLVDHPKNVRLPSYFAESTGIQMVMTPVGYTNGAQVTFFGDQKYQIVSPGRDSLYGAIREDVLLGGASETAVETKTRLQRLRDNICNFANSSRIDSMQIAIDSFGF